MKKIILVTMILVIAGCGNLFAQRGGRAAETLEVKLASPLPRESPWGRTLEKIASEWNRITGGQVRLNIRHGGIEGNESKMLMSLASDTIQAAILTSFGLSEINPAVMTLSIPFLIRNDAELNAVMGEVERDLEAKLNAGNYFLVAWSKSGFVNIFSKEQILTPDQLRRQKIASNAEAAEMNAVFNSMGFPVVESDMSDMGPKLNAGAITAIYQNPASVAAFQLHTITKNMLSTNIAAILGGIIINQVTWRKIGNLNPRYQQELITTTRRIAQEFDTSLQKSVNDAVQSMVKGGLIVNRPTAAQEQLWYSDLEKAVPSLLGTTFDRDLYQKVTAILTRYRGGR